MKNTTINKQKNNYKPHDLEFAISEFIKRGGAIESASAKETIRDNCETLIPAEKQIDTKEEYARKVELLKNLITKGAGISALQYSLKMNKGEIRRIAQEQGLRIPHRRPLSTTRKYRSTLSEPADSLADDVIAGHAMHYAALGYTAMEIAQALELTVRQVWELGRSYRFELRHHRDDPRE
ncbi:hypothetical protein [Pseudomonas gingeri]|uniref:Uncharacterized protein n=1 Tax=Pseudomonas gingeri TaxID=117681 RepID=A0A7Y7YDE9_9PSED|nr:hypothetical protein [Pseudomonas gingeri]NWA01523.1 hypothetical protein [Pseudomonas gingeri]NWA13674.1 hypothetical protein [Pseudomonas gingeri]NWA52966.1 hypothetical protein [Pseudomonas gingeri]NWA96463.1 hypothetical protein [Pseudomonas gingeri]NWA99900.1 hypothetical protein [Pseudomonas gingeri]